MEGIKYPLKSGGGGDSAVLTETGEPINEGALLGLVNDKAFKATPDINDIISEFDISTNQYDYLEVVRLTSTRVVCFYKAVSGHSYIKLFDYDYTTKKYNSLYGGLIFDDSVLPIQFQATPMSDDTVALLYVADYPSDRPSLKIFKITDTEILYGTTKTIESIDSDCYDILKLEDNKLMIVYKNNTNSVSSCVVATFDEHLQITNGSVFDYESAKTYDSVLTLLEPNKVLLVYRESSTNYMKGVVVNISGTNITYATKATLISSGCSHYSRPILVDTNKVIMFYSDLVDITGKIATISVSSDTPSLVVSTEAFATGAISNPHIIKLNDELTNFVAVFSDSNTDIAYHLPFTYDGSSFTFGVIGSYCDETAYVSVGSLSASELENGYAVIFYSRSGVTKTTLACYANKDQVLATGYTPIGMVKDGDGVNKVPYVKF